MKDEMGQEVLGFANGDRFPQGLVVQKATTLTAVRTQNWHCGACGSSLLATTWKHYETALKNGYQDYHCMNAKCVQYDKTLRIPLTVEHFPEV